MFTQLEFNQDVWLNLSLILFHAVWQGALIGFLLWSLDKIIRRSLPALRYGVFVTGLWLVLLLPIFTWIVTTNFHSESELKNSSQAKEFPAKLTVSQDSANVLELPSVLSNWNKSETHVPAELNQQDLQSSEVSLTLPRQLRSLTSIGQGSPSSLPIRPEVIGLVWGIGVFWFTLRLLIGTLWIFKISASKTGLDPEIQSWVQRLSQTQQWSGAPRVFVSSKIHEAIVVGYLRPMVLVPLSWTTHLTPETLEAVIIHELTHIRRFDLWMILVQRIAETLLFFHPVVWWISKRISIERELCCDAESVRILDSNLAYAKALEQVAQRLLEQSQANSFNPRWLSCLLSLNFGGQKMELLARIQHVLQLSPQQVPARRPPRHGIAMLLVPLLIVGSGLSLVQVLADSPPQKISTNEQQEPPQPTPQRGNHFKPEKEPAVESGQGQEKTGCTMFGVGVNSDAGVTGKLTLDESNFEELFKNSLDEKRYGIHIKQENFAVLAERMQLDSASNTIRLEQGKLLIRWKDLPAKLQADQIELKFSELTDVFSKSPSMIRATGHVMFIDIKIPDGEPELLSGDEFEWNLNEKTIQMRDTGTAVNRLSTIFETTDSSSKENVSRTPHEWNLIHEQALSQLSDFTYHGISLEKTLIDIGKHQFHNRLVIDERELKKSGVSLNEEVDVSLSGIILQSSLKLILEPYGLSFYIDEGKFVVTSALKATHHRVTREYDVSQILKHDEFFQHPHPVTASETRIQQLIEYLDTEPASLLQSGESTPAVHFHPLAQRVQIVAPQPQQDLARQRMELLQGVLKVERDTNFTFRSQKIFSTFRSKHNVIEKSLRELKYQNRVFSQHDRIRQNLQKLISVDFQDRPLSEFMQFIANHAGINIVIDDAGLAEAGISSKEPITVHLEHVYSATAINIVLQSLGLASMIEDEVLKVTSEERAQGGLQITVYQIKDLVGDAEDVKLEFERLIETIRMVVAPESWDNMGGSGSLSAHFSTNSLVVRQVRLVHDEIEWLLAEMRNIDSRGENSSNDCDRKRTAKASNVRFEECHAPQRSGSVTAANRNAVLFRPARSR